MGSQYRMDRGRMEKKKYGWLHGDKTMKVGVRGKDSSIVGNFPGIKS